MSGLDRGGRFIRRPPVWAATCGPEIKGIMLSTSPSHFHHAFTGSRSVACDRDERNRSLSHSRIGLAFGRPPWAFQTCQMMSCCRLSSTSPSRTCWHSNRRVTVISTFHRYSTRYTQTCRVLHAFGSTDYLWHRLIERSGLLLDIPTDTPITDLTSDDLQRHAIHAIRLQLNWRRPSSNIKRITSLGTTTDALFDHLHFVPGGKWLLAVQGLYRRFENRNFTKISFWSLSHTQDAHCVAHFEMVGKHRASAVAMRDVDGSATFAIALNYADQE